LAETRLAGAKAARDSAIADADLALTERQTL